MAGSDLQTKLVCVECGQESDGGACNWRAFLTDDEQEPAEVAIYCEFDA